MVVKRRGSIGMIEYVREQARSVGQLALADAGTVHAGSAYQMSDQ